MSRKGNCWDNAPMESFFHTLKTELGNALRLQDPRPMHASACSITWKCFYNRLRRHSTINYVAPLAFEAINQRLSRLSTRSWVTSI